MPLYDEEVSKELFLEEALESLAEKFGPFQIQQALSRFDWMPIQSSQDKTKQQEVTLNEAIAHYYSSDAFTGLAKSSQQVYKYEMNLFSDYCRQRLGGQPTIAQISAATFLNDYLAPVKKPNTRNKKSAFLRSFLGEVHAHFFQGSIEKLKRPLSIDIDRNREPRAFTKEQLDELLNLVRLGKEAHRNFTILWTFLGSGIRLNELCHLQVGDIIPSRQEILVRGKGKKGYKQPNKITKSSLDILSAYVKFRYGGVENEPAYQERYIFSSDKGISPLHDSTVQKMISALIDEAKTISEFDKKSYQLSTHSFRHSFALYLLESGVNIYTIKELMRHERLSSTEVYLKLFNNMLVHAIDKHPLAQIRATDFFHN
ncbi:tyrosine-type recombinase/integrase [Brevibacillus sp. 179-C9.3 HS]|uniref:tyrosine-type recombinase/integrase n=1 Tax=unclassified Brevibacillus TaxID=2684853 RepID=UPI0039A18710